MLRQRFGTNPATGRVEHYYVDEGPHGTGLGNQRPLVATFVMGSRPGANVSANGGAKVKALKGLGR